MSEWESINRAWVEISSWKDPTLCDEAADEMLRNPEQERAAIDHAVAHMRLVNAEMSNAIDALGYAYSYEPQGWSRGTEAVYQARILQQIGFHYHRKAPAPQRLTRVVARYTFMASYLYATPSYVKCRDWHFIVVPYVYIEFVQFTTQALVGCLSPGNPSGSWAAVGKALAPMAECPPVMRKLFARLLTHHAFDPLAPGDNVVQKLVEHSDWFANAEEAVEISPMEVHLGYSAVDFALSHELGHRYFDGLDLAAIGADEEEEADRLGFELYQASWGWRADLLEDTPLGDACAILLGPIWFFYTAGLILQIKLALKQRYDRLDLPFEPSDEENQKDPLEILLARWEKQRASSLGFLSYLDETTELHLDEVNQLVHLIERAEEFRRLCLVWIEQIPEADIRYAASM